MKDGLKALLSLILSCIIIVLLIIGGGLICGSYGAIFIFTPLYYLLAWNMGILKPVNPKFIMHGIIPAINIIAFYSLLIIFIHERVLSGDLNVFLGKKKD